MITMGIDIGSASSKAVIMENGKKILGKYMLPIGIGTSGPADVYKEVQKLAMVSREDIDCLVATGYGRLSFSDSDIQMSELSCHGKGMHYLIPQVRTVIDIGGQDAKVMRLGDNGALFNFVMNDKCAAGTGRFLEVMARVLNVNIGDLGEISEKSKQEVSISSVCTVFAESEVISHLASGESMEDIVAGIHKSVAKKVASLANRIGIEEQIGMSGGVALNKGVLSALEKELNHKIYSHEDAQLAGAYGAAIIGYEKSEK